VLIDAAARLDPAPPLGAGLPPDDACGELARRLRGETEGEVLFDAASRGRYATDASIYQIMPVGVLVPKTEADIGAAIDIARDLKVPVLPRGAGTSQCGQTTGAALVIDTTKHFRKLLELDVAGHTASVEPGLVLDDLNAQLKPHGLWFPVDVSTSAQATLGGMAGNNSCGSRTATWCTTCSASGPACRTAPSSISARSLPPAAAPPRSPPSSTAWRAGIAAPSRRAGRR
jgi:hypothetical protein